jgi:hypothetical protein
MYQHIGMCINFVKQWRTLDVDKLLWAENQLENYESCRKI